MTYQSSEGGINSLAGFAYQIKVFSYFAFCLKDGMQVEFETIEDINIKTVVPDKIDEYSQNFVCKINDNGVNKAIQVKHTSVSRAVAQQMILNWILLEHSSYNVEKYILFTKKIYHNDSDIFFEDVDTLHKIVVESKKKADATISKVKHFFEADFNEFKKMYNQIQSKFEFIDLEDIDEEIYKKSSMHFRKVSNLIVFGQRIKEFCQHITIKILEAIENKQGYILTYVDFINLIEDISSRFTLEITSPSYSNFKSINKIKLHDSQLSNSREYMQLRSCELSDQLINQQLLYCMYYYETSLMYMENNRVNKIEDIEETTFENFERAKFHLQNNGIDTPYNRLELTQGHNNSFAQNDPIKYGSSIHLTVSV